MPVPLTVPGPPNEEGRERRMLIPLTSDSWCEHCVTDRGAQQAHSQKVAEEKLILRAFLKMLMQQPESCTTRALLWDLRSRCLGEVLGWTYWSQHWCSSLALWDTGESEFAQMGSLQSEQLLEGTGANEQ